MCERGSVGAGAGAGAGAGRRAAAARRRAAAATGLAVALGALLLLLVLLSYAAEWPLLGALRAARSSVPDDVACYAPDDFPSAEAGALDDDAAALRPTESSIFFHETTCGAAGAAGAVRLTARQACAVESAAVLHPHRTVYVLVMAGGGGARSRNVSQWSAAARALLAYPNVRVARVAIARFVRGTPLHAWFAAGALVGSRWPRSHASDVLRFLTLWRFGGTYLDLDVVVTRPLDGLRNFAGAESATDLGSSVLGFARDALGRRVAAECLRELRDDFDGNDWSHNGPGVITRVLQRLCDASQVSDMTPERCAGFRVLPPSAFFPVPWPQWRRYFQEQGAALTMAAINGSYVIHVWNRMSAAAIVSLHSEQPYAQVARQFCPRVAQSAGAYF
ncbi:hypothetical protein R5R35_003700 [Gryllus longicercus]|uniref:Alpha 1,4-glycosyltransferase domain-containing protein n=1 Tax=Gryllus longicercus TaxID=2509291 RepID=A0AAN9VU52_9ORTH